MKASQTRVSQLRFTLLGGCDLQDKDGPVQLETHKTTALLCYLIINPGWHSRQRLSGIFWGEFPQDKAFANLRRALWNIRKSVTIDGEEIIIHTNRHSVSFNPSMPYWLDVQNFERACQALDSLSAENQIFSRFDDYSPDLELYKGPFLQGFSLPGAPAFEEWVLIERERLSSQAFRAFLHVVKTQYQMNQPEQALIYAQQLLNIDPWNEITYRWLMRLLNHTGKRSEALEQFEICKRVLMDAFNVEPTQETMQLAQQIMCNSIDPIPVSLPVPATPFIGRVKELREVTELIQNKDCRLVTLTGLGGTGKTRLAIKLASKQTHLFENGIHFFDLNNITQVEAFAPTLLESLAIPVMGPLDSQAVLLSFLQSKEMLLIFDGFEHLQEAATLLMEILQSAPNVKILVTSRHRLQLSGEWTYPLLGLSYPGLGETEQLDQFEAVQLFRSVAKRTSYDFQIQESDNPFLIQICHQVSGHPLALELVGAAVDQFPLQTISAKIMQQFDFLANTIRDLPERHQSLKAVFNFSWELLSNDEKTALKRISIASNPFDQEQAIQISGASAITLQALVDKSLLQRQDPSYYALHEMIRQYAVEKLSPDERDQVSGKHCEVYSTLLKEYQGAAIASENFPILQKIDQEWGNFLLAWNWAVSHQVFPAICCMYAALADHFHIKSSFRNGEKFFGESLHALWGDDEPDEQRHLFWQMACNWASFLPYLGKLAEAHTLLKKCQKVFEQEEDLYELAHCLFFLGEIARFSGAARDALSYLEESLHYYKIQEHYAGVGFCQNSLGLVHISQGDLQEGQSLFESSLSHFYNANHEMGQAIVNLNLTALLLQLENLPEAKQLLEKTFKICEKLGHHWGMATCYRNRALIRQKQGDLNGARSDYLESLRILQEIGQQQSTSRILVDLGRISVQLGEYELAQAYLRDACRIALEIQDTDQILNGLSALSALFMKTDHQKFLQEVTDLEKEFKGDMRNQGESLQKAFKGLTRLIAKLI